MAEEIPVSSVALANGENESNDKEFPDDVAVEEENTSDKDAAAASRDRGAAVELLSKKIQGLNESNEFADAVAVEEENTLYKTASKDLAKWQKLKVRLDLLKQREDLIKGRCLDLHKRIDDLEAKQRALGMALAVGVAVLALEFVTLYLFKQK